MPTPMLKVRSISACSTRPRACTRPNTGCGVQVARSIVADRCGGRTRARLAASPPPVTCENTWTSVSAIERQAVLGVDARRDEQLLAERAAELVDVGVERQPRALQQHVAHQREAVAVQAAAAPWR